MNLIARQLAEHRKIFRQNGIFSEIVEPLATAQGELKSLQLPEVVPEKPPMEFIFPETEPTEFTEWQSPGEITYPAFSQELQPQQELTLLEEYRRTLEREGRIFAGSWEDA